MFNIDRQSLNAAIAISLEPNLHNVEDKRSVHIQYFHIVINCAVACMNSKFRNIDDAIEEQYDRFPDDRNMLHLGEVIRQLVVDMKMQFIQAGFDSRLKYKLITRKVHSYTLYAIGMDIEETVRSFNDSLPTEEEILKEELPNAVTEEPSLDQLNAAYNW